MGWVWWGVGVASVALYCGSGVSGLLVVERLGHGPFGNCGETCVDKKRGVTLCVDGGGDM